MENKSIPNMKTEKFIYHMPNIIHMPNIDTLRKLEGLHTIETIAEDLNITKGSAMNLITKLKKEQHATIWAGGRKKIYKITIRKQRPQSPGMFDIINKYSPKMQLNPWYDHQVHGKYEVEDALVEAVQTQSFRAILASLNLFKHITNWPKLYKLAKEKDVWQQIGAMYDVAKMFFRVRAMPEKYKNKKYDSHRYLIKNYPTKEEKFKTIRDFWNVDVPFRMGDLAKVTG